MARILVLTGRFPFPPDDGWRIRVASLIRGLARAGHEVHLLSFSHEAPSATEVDVEPVARVVIVPRGKAYAPVDLLRGLITRRPFSVLNYRQREYSAAFDDLCSQYSYQAIIAEDIVMAQYVANWTNGARILDMHNIESDLLQRFSRETKHPFKRLYARITARKLRHYERVIANTFDMVLTCSANDHNRLVSQGVSTDAHIIPNGVQTSYYSTVPDESTEEGVIAFVGSMDYHANISGVLNFARETLPTILNSRPDLRFYIVGKNPPERVRALASANIIVTGAVDDVRPYLARASVIVVPLLVGGGTRLKILEAMAARRPVVSTSLGAEGIESDHRHIVLADEPQVFAAAVLELLATPAMRERIASAAYEFVSSRYDWSVITTGLDQALAPLFRQRDNF